MTDEPDDDPFEGVTFDDSFVADASRREDSADERIERWRHIDAEHRRIIEHARAQVREQAADLPSLSTPPARRSNRGRWAVIVVGILVIAFFWVRARESDDPAQSAGQDSAVEAVGGRPTPSSIRLEGGQPPPGVGSQPAPLGRPAPAPSGDGSFAFVATQDGTDEPVAYDPCRPIHLVVNTRTAPPEGDALLREAVARVSAATGLQFVIDGETGEMPARGRSPYQPDRYPGRWAPVLVAWSDGTESPGLDGAIAGEAGSAWFELPAGAVYVSGSVLLDGPDLADIVQSRGGRAVARGIIQHELGHLVGLDHVPDPTELMYAETVPDVVDFGTGDRQGLAELGTGRCFPEI